MMDSSPGTVLCKCLGLSELIEVFICAATVQGKMMYMHICMYAYSSSFAIKTQYYLTRRHERVINVLQK